MTKKMVDQVCVRLTENEKTNLARLARYYGLSPGAVLRELLQYDWLKKQELVIAREDVGKPR